MKFDIDRKKVNIFKIGGLYCFKQYLAVYQAIEQGAEKFTDEIDVERLIL